MLAGLDFHSFTRREFDLSAVELVNTLDKERMRFVPYDRHSDHYSITFPFDLDITGDFNARIENPNILIRPDRDYLDGAFIGNFVLGRLSVFL